MVSTIHEVNQWGRKDPFTPATNTGYVNAYNAKEVQIYNANGIAITKGVVSAEAISEQFKFEDKVITTINNLIQNPSTHYHKGDGTNNVPIASTEYYKDTKEGDWWNPTIKTIYDPCPNGYRIPESGTYGTGSNITTHKDWSVWSEGGLKSGRIFKNSSFFPASGQRNLDNGQFSIVTTYCFSWMSTASNATNGHYLYLISGLIDPNRSAGRSYGLPTRCIKE